MAGMEEPPGCWENLKNALLLGTGRAWRTTPLLHHEGAWGPFSWVHRKPVGCLPHVGRCRLSRTNRARLSREAETLTFNAHS